MIVNQWIAAAHAGDAIGDNALHLRRILQRLGHTAEIYSPAIDETLVAEVRPFDDPAATCADVTLFHFALASPMTEAFARLPSGRRILQYHNVTPARFFATYDPALYRLAEEGRRQLASLRECVDLALGVSDYNRRELEAAGFERTAVLPIAVDVDRLRTAPACPALEAVLDDGLTNILFVGRIVPNKCIEDHIRLAARYARRVDPACRFVFVGRNDAVPAYYSAVLALVERAGLPRDRFVFTGAVPAADLAACYRTASAYVSMSEHEGFCVPLVEAMAMDVPVLAYAAAAVPETLGGAGIAFFPKDFDCAAELLGMIVYDETVRSAVVEGQRRRLRDFRDDEVMRRVANIMEEAS